MLVMQIGVDIFCDIIIMLVELEKWFQILVFNLFGYEGFVCMVVGWIDGKWFQMSVGVIFGVIGDQMLKEFIEDCIKMLG